jgi:hypothetical protein
MIKKKKKCKKYQRKNLKSLKHLIKRKHKRRKMKVLPIQTMASQTMNVTASKPKEDHMILTHKNLPKRRPLPLLLTFMATNKNPKTPKKTSHNLLQSPWPNKTE